MMLEIKNNLFTIHGIITSVIHLLIVVGLLCSWMFFNVQVLGNDVSFSMPSESAIKERIKK